METVGSVEEVREALRTRGRCKIKIPADEYLMRSLAEADLEDIASWKGIALVPRGVTKVLLACIAATGPEIAKAALEGHRLGLKRKKEGWFLYIDTPAARPEGQA